MLRLICFELITTIGFYLDSLAIVRSRGTAFSYNAKESLLTLIEKDHLGDWRPVRKPFSESLKMASAHVVETSVTNNSPSVLRTPITQMIFSNQGMLLQGLNHFLKLVDVRA